MMKARSRMAGLAVALSLGACAAPGSMATGDSPHAEPWGRTRAGVAVDKVRLRNRLGMQVAYIDYGATLTELVVPDREGRLANVVLSVPTLAAFEANQRRYGAEIGRYAGRIDHARFVLDGLVVQLQPNAKGVYLHADPDGFDRRVWSRRDFSEADSLGSVFTMDSPAGDQHFPGHLRMEVTYRLARAHNELCIEYRAETDAPTVLNPTNHVFLNLAGAGSHGLAGHSFTIAADRYAATDARRIPTGALLDVTGTVLDFRRPADVIGRLASGDALLGQPAGFDHSLVFSGWDGRLRPVLRVDDATSGRRLDLSTTEPSAQFNAGSGFDGGELGSEGRAYERGDGFAFETQHLPDSPNHPNFPSTRLDPGQRFESRTCYVFGTSSTRPGDGRVIPGESGRGTGGF
ncbi:MAG TPA: aldose epimerase family protein [Burkholderiaceae bacterium]|jgi:aldose 1-epimerase